MKSLWPFVVGLIYCVALVAIATALYGLGSVVGGVLEMIIRAIPGFVYELPSHIATAFLWLVGIVWTIISNPLRAICVIFGILLVITYFRGINGAFGEANQTFRGSTVRSAEDVFPDIDNSSHEDFYPNPSRLRGSSLGDYESIFNSHSESWRSKTWDRLKALITRRFGGDELR